MLRLLPLAAVLLICACKKNDSSSPRRNANSTYYAKLKLLSVGSAASPEYATITDGQFNLSRSE